MRTELEVWIDENSVENYREVYDWYVSDDILWIETKTEVIAYMVENIFKFVSKK